MHSRFGDNVGVRDATFNEKRSKRLRFDDLAPWFDRLEQLTVFPADSLPEDPVGRFEWFGAPDRDRQEAGRADQSPEPPDRAL